MIPDVPVIVGGTATGKSRLAIDVARLLLTRGRRAEIVNADSMLVYRGMDIGTAKPTADERALVTHHLIDIMDVTQTASVAEFQQMARATIARLRADGVVPIVVGGSALYVRAIVDHFEFPGHDPAIRQRWEDELAQLGPERLHARLAAISPESAAQIEPGNGRRIVRALEVAELTGGHRPRLPEWTYELTGVHQYGLTIARDVLDHRIEQRVDAMWEAGLVDEVRALEQRGLREGKTASRAIGYRQVLEFLDGECDEEQAKANVKSATRKFFRRQLAWYRRDQRIRWLDADDSANAELIARLHC